MSRVGRVTPGGRAPGGRAPGGPELTVTSRNARFQQWLALLDNRRKRQRAGEFLVQGVRPITLAVRRGWPLRALLYDMRRPLSSWAAGVLAGSGAPTVAMAPELLGELGEKPGDPPEIVAVAALPADDYARIPVRPGFLGLVCDRPANPGNIGTLLRSADAFGAGALIVTGHAADPYDPRSVRASTGSVFAVPVVREASHRGVLEWLRRVRAAGGVPVTLVGMEEKAGLDIAAQDLTKPSLIVLGNEAAGLASAWRDACDRLVRIPMSGSASSLNMANAGTVALYEAARQRAAAAPPARP